MNETVHSKNLCFWNKQLWSKKNIYFIRIPTRAGAEARECLNKSYYYLFRLMPRFKMAKNTFRGRRCPRRRMDCEWDRGRSAWGASLPQLGLPQCLMRRLGRRWQRWRNQGELCMIKGERRRQAGEQSFERIFANQLYIKFSGDIGWL